MPNRELRDLHMKTTHSNLPPIPVDYIVDHALTLTSDSKRRPYVDLINMWAEHEGMGGDVDDVISSITGKPAINAKHMPKEFYARYRESEKAARLIEIVRGINKEIAYGDTMWTWPHVMRVMVDENVIMSDISPNRFDAIICSMIPGKGHDTVRKNGNYNIMFDRTDSYRLWSPTSPNPVQATNREICDQIAERFKPILSRYDTKLTS